MKKIQNWAALLKSNTYALYLASKDPRVPILAKIVIGIVVAYAVSPIDLIPDFIPIIGYLDDILLLPIGIWIAIRLIPYEIWLECQMLAEKRLSEMPRNRRAAVIIVIVWLLTAAAFIIFAWNFMNNVKSD